MSVLVTGCAGFIGARICERLLGEGRPVIGVDLVDAPEDVEQRRRRLIALGGRHGDRFQFRRVDVRDGDAVGATLASADQSRP
jgi:UDP-glucuronate 4-epimerase